MTLTETFTDIYRRNVWGSSGGGSDPGARAPWCRCVSDFIADMKPARVISVGCGDGWADAEIELGGAEYIGVDIVPEIIGRARVAHPHRRFELSPVEFKRGDLVLLKEVTQHLSYESILDLLDSMKGASVIIHCSAGSDNSNACDIEDGGYRGVGMGLKPLWFPMVSLTRWKRSTTEYHAEALLRCGYKQENGGI